MVASCGNKVSPLFIRASLQYYHSIFEFLIALYSFQLAGGFIEFNFRKIFKFQVFVLIRQRLKIQYHVGHF